MDQELQNKIDEARANGYTDDQINEYLGSQTKDVLPTNTAESKTLPGSTPWVDRSEEHRGLAQGIAGKAALTGAEAYLGYQGLKKLVNTAGKAFGNSPVSPTTTATGPVSPGGELSKTTFTGGANQAFDTALSKPYNQFKSVPAMVGNMAAPAAAFALPYAASAGERANILANPTAPEYANNPFAMTVRGQAPTQASAGAMNQRNLVRTQPNPQAALDMMMRKEAAKKALQQSQR